MSNIVKAQHTPGPWKVKGPSKPTPETPKGGDFCILDADGQIIAEVFRQVGAGEPGLRPAETNARLIAAAPELLAVLLELQESAGYWSEYDVPVGIVDRINAVIAKAAGEQP